MTVSEAMQEVAFGNTDSMIMLVDCGYVDDYKGRDNADSLIALGIGKRNIGIVMNGRVVCHIPPTKKKNVLRELPVVKGGVYAYTTHHFKNLEKEVTNESPEV
jgi:hypothetical protein